MTIGEERTKSSWFPTTLRQSVRFAEVFTLATPIGSIKVSRRIFLKHVSFSIGFDFFIHKI
jgi:hypothetical protein